jgi:signal peptidase I
MVQKDEGMSLTAPMIMELIEAVHEKGASFRFQAKGFSMTPAIRNGDIITVSPLANLNPGRGDVVAFRHPERPQMLVHRVLYGGRNGFFVRGDSCPEADGWVPLANVIGIVTRVEGQGGNVFWPDRRHAWARFYFRLYTLWPPLRRLLVRGYRSLKK